MKHARISTGKVRADATYDHEDHGNNTGLPRNCLYKEIRDRRSCVTVPAAIFPNVCPLYYVSLLDRIQLIHQAHRRISGTVPADASQMPKEFESVFRVRCLVKVTYYSALQRQLLCDPVSPRQEHKNQLWSECV